MIDLLNPNKEEIVAKWRKELDAVAHLNKWDLESELAFWAEWSLGRTHILELGAYNAASTKIMLLANPELRIEVVDLWQDEGTHETFLAAIETFKDRVHWNRMSTEEFFKRGCDIQFDGLLVDAGHTESEVALDITEGMKLMKPGTLCTGHDYRPNWNDGVFHAIQKAFEGNVHNPVESIWCYQMPL